MKIGIEASRLTESQRTGTENYLYNLVRKFSEIDKKNKYILYFRETPSEKLWGELSGGNSNFSYRVPKRIFSWTQVGLALELFRETPDVLFCTWHTMPGINPFWKMKTISSMHDAFGRFIPSFWTAHFSHKLICVSAKSKRDVARRFMKDDDNISVIHEGRGVSLVPASEDEIKRVKDKYGIEGDYIFFLSTLGPRKNLENITQAYEGLHENLSFVASGKIMAGSEHLTELPMTYIGRSEDEDLSGLITGAKFLVFASKDEGFGLPMLEAMDCGTPVLASDIEVLREIAGEAAVFVDPDSVEDIRRGMGELLTDEALCKDLVRKGFENVKRFSWENSAQQLLTVFEEVTSEE